MKEDAKGVQSRYDVENQLVDKEKRGRGWESGGKKLIRTVEEFARIDNPCRIKVKV